MWSWSCWLEQEVAKICQLCFITLIYYLRKGGSVFTPSVGGLVLSGITQKLLEGFQQNLVGGRLIGQRTADLNFAADLDKGIFAFLLISQHDVENSGICKRQVAMRVV